MKTLNRHYNPVTRLLLMSALLVGGAWAQCANSTSIVSYTGGASSPYSVMAGGPRNVYIHWLGTFGSTEQAAIRTFVNGLSGTDYWKIIVSYCDGPAAGSPSVSSSLGPVAAEFSSTTLPGTSGGMQTAVINQLSNDLVTGWPQDSNALYVYLASYDIPNTSGGICGEHNETQFGGLSAPVLHYIWASAYSGCQIAGSNGAVVDSMTRILSHEIAESITDANGINGWRSGAFETADYCQSNRFLPLLFQTTGLSGTGNANIVISGQPFLVQSMLRNFNGPKGPGCFLSSGQPSLTFSVDRPSTGQTYVHFPNGRPGMVLTGDYQQVYGGDFDSDGFQDNVFWNKATGWWYIFESGGGQGWGSLSFQVQWGLPGDTPMLADYDGDGHPDLVIARLQPNGSGGYVYVWYITTFASGFTSGPAPFVWGQAGDSVFMGDIDGDNKADPIVYRPSTTYWYALRSTNGTLWVPQWGLPGDTPIVGDFDGDGHLDIAVSRNQSGLLFVYELLSSTGYTSGPAAIQWGLAGDIPLAMDMDGDKVTDLVVARFYSGAGWWWYTLPSSDTPGGYYTQWGLPGDVIN